MATLDSRPILPPPVANDDYIHVVDRSDLTSSPDGTSKQINVSDFRELGDLQNITFNNAGTIGPSGNEVLLDLNQVGSFFRIRDNVNVNVLSVSSVGNVVVEKNNLSITTGDININTGNLIVQQGNITTGNVGPSNLIMQNGDIDIQSGTLDVSGVSTFLGAVSGFRFTGNSLTKISGNMNVSGSAIININAGTQSNITAGVLEFRVSTTEFRFQGANINFDSNRINQLNGIQARTGIVDPTIAEVATGDYIGFFNSVLGQMRIWYNDAGVMRSTAAFT